MINPKYKKPKITSGDLKTPVIFFEYDSSNGPEPGDEEKKVLYKCFAEVYNPSMKDMDIINSSNKATKEAVTINIRDPGIDYLPSNKHKAVLDDYRYKNKVWEIVSVSPDLKNRAFIKIILAVTS